MKAHHISIIVAIICMAIFVKPNKVNMNLSTEEIMEKVAQSPEGIESFIQKTTLQSSIVDGTETQVNDTQSYRLEHRMLNGVSHDYLSGTHSYVDFDDAYHSYFLHLLEDDYGDYSDYIRRQTRAEFDAFREEPNAVTPTIDYGPWEKKERQRDENMPYAVALDEFQKLAPEMEKKEGEKNYVLSLERDDLSLLDEGEQYYLDEMMNRIGLSEETIRNTQWTDVDMRIRFVVERHEMRIQNAYFLLRLHDGTKRYQMQYSTDYEQFNIVGEPQLPSTAPPRP